MISVAQLAKTGHRVEFGADDGHSVHATSGQRLQLQRAGGVYLLYMLVRGATGPGAGPAPSGGGDLALLKGSPRGASGFSRPSR